MHLNDYWFPYVTMIFNLLFIRFMPKNLTKWEMYHTWWMLSALTIYSDLFFGDVLDLYDFGEKSIQFMDLPIEALLPPSFGIIFLNFLPENNKRYIIYLMFWTMFSVAYEWLTVFFGFERLKGWVPWYSAPIYLLVFIFLKWHLHSLRKK